MKYTEFKALIDENSISKLCKLLKTSSRNSDIDELQDYYDGKQWGDGVVNTETRYTRSGKEMWKKWDEQPYKGFNKGELKVWNWIKLAINTYAKYSRGDESEDIEIMVKEKGVTNDDLTNEAKTLFPDINEWVLENVKKMCITSVLPTKYTYIAQTGTADERAVLKTITMDKDADIKGLVEVINPKEIEPLYWHEKIRGMIRFYMISKEEAKTYGYQGSKKDVMYLEAWYVDDSGVLTLDKYVDDLKVEGDAKPYTFIPYHVQPNSKSSKGSFDLDNLEDSDAGDLIDTQDDINAFLTDLNTIYRKVAIPMLKVSDKFVSESTPTSMAKAKEMFSNMNTMAGSILWAPLEKMGANGPADSQVAHLQDMIDQFYRQTGIPKSVFNSEGLANIATETLTHLFQSLKVRVADKRTQIAKVIKQNVKMHLISINKWNPELEIEVSFPDMFGTTNKERADLLIAGKKEKLLPTLYVIKEFIELLGDGEDTEEILAMLAEEDASFKLYFESVLNAQEIKANTQANNRQLPAPSKQVNDNVDNKNRDLKELNGENQPS